MNQKVALKLILNGADCASCAIGLEQVVKDIPGVSTAVVNPVSETVTVEYDDARAHGSAYDCCHATAESDSGANQQSAGHADEPASPNQYASRSRGDSNADTISADRDTDADGDQRATIPSRHASFAPDDDWSERQRAGGGGLSPWNESDGWWI